MQAGDPIEPIEMTTITREQLKEYAEASGDHNQIHQDDQVAQAAGLPGVIAHGMLIAGLLSSRVCDWITSDLDASWKISYIQSRFKSMTFPGEKIIVGGVIRKVEGQQIELQVKAYNHQAEMKVLGKIQLKQQNP